MPERLDTDVVRRWAGLGLEALARHRDEIDALNVFPVPDGDTGTNMYLTFSSAAEALDEEVAAQGEALDLPVSLASLARGALLGARGNSGIILSQIVRGFADAVEGAGDRAVAGTDVLVAAFRRASDSAYAAVAEPREGTVLSVVRAAADAVGLLGPGTSLAGVVTAAADAASEALARTPDQLEVLARAGVVDAGGRGLVVILDALVETVTGDRRESGVEPPALPLDLDDLDGEGGAYEVMFLLDSDDSAVPALRAALTDVGDSVVVVGGGGLWNVHVHTDDIGAAVEAGIAAGRPHRIRVTDLRDDVSRRTGRASGRRLVAVAHGAGTAALLDTADVTVVRAMGHVAPSTAEFLDGVERARTTEVVLLPSDSDSRPVAEAAAEQARAAGVRASVIPTRSIVQTLAAVAVHDPEARFDDDVVSMTRAAGATRYGGVSIAVKEAVTSAGRCSVGDVLGIVEGDVVEIGSTVDEVVARVLGRLLSTGGELVTLVHGDELEPTEAESIARGARRAHPGVEVTVYDGGQPYWPLILGVE